MSFSLTAMILWAACFLGNLALIAVLIFRGRARMVPWFTAWVGFNLLYTLALFGAYRLGTKQSYVLLYWGGAFLDLALQVGIVFEIARYVFRRGGAWVGGAKHLLLWSGGVSVVAGVLLGLWMKPLSTSRLDAWESRVDLGATVLISLLFTAVMVLSERLGVSWRSVILREGYGVAAWSVCSFVTDTLHAYWRTAEHFTILEHLRVVFYLGALGYWLVIFWLPEPATLVPDAATKRGIESFRRQLE